jgi:hypothetical protein
MVLSTIGIVYAPIRTPNLYLNPTANTGQVNASTTINVDIEDASNLYSYQTSLGFDPNLLEPISVDEGPFIRDNTPAPETFFTYVIEADSVTVACLPLGVWPGVNGSGNLFTVTFNIIDAGGCDLPLSGTILLDSTGAEIPSTSIGGTFHTIAEANLVKKSAWPEHHHFDVSKDEDGNQTLYAIVKNLDHLDLYVKVVFDIVRDDALFATVESAEATVLPLEQQTLSAEFGLLTPGDAGKYYVSARAWYSWSGSYWSPGAKVKTFSFAVVP